MYIILYKNILVADLQLTSWQFKEVFAKEYKQIPASLCIPGVVADEPMELSGSFILSEDNREIKDFDIIRVSGRNGEIEYG